MELKFFSSSRPKKKELLIGKTGHLRFKRAVSEDLGIELNQGWMVATDKKESVVKTIYVIKAEKGTEGAFKVKIINKNFCIDFQSIIEELGLSKPVRCRYEKVNDKGMVGFKMILNEKK